MENLDLLLPTVQSPPEGNNKTEADDEEAMTIVEFKANQIG